MADKTKKAIDETLVAHENGSAIVPKTKVAAEEKPIKRKTPKFIIKKDDDKICGKYVIQEVLEPHAPEKSGIYLCKSESYETVIIKVAPTNRPPKKDLLDKLRNVSRKNLINIYDVIYEDDIVYEVLEHCKGGSLSKYIPLPEKRIINEIIPEVVNALKDLHNIGVFHRDIKPDNIFFRNVEKDVVVGDFDISSVSESDSSSRLSRTLAGTWKYCPPEFFIARYNSKTGQKRTRISKSMDYYALGVTILELLKYPVLVGFEYDDIANFYSRGEKIEIPNSVSGRLKVLLAWLIVRDKEKRWGAVEVEKWINGKEFSLPEDTFLATKTEIIPYKIMDKEAYNFIELANICDYYWKDAKGDFMSGDLMINWVGIQDTNVARELKNIREGQSQNPDLALLEAIFFLNPERPYKLLYGLEAKTPEELARQIYARPEDWKDNEIPKTYQAAVKQLWDGSIIAWLRQRKYDELIKKWNSIKAKFETKKEAGLENFSRTLDPTIPKILLSISIDSKIYDKRGKIKKWVVERGKEDTAVIRYKTNGCGIPYVSVKLDKETPGLDLVGNLHEINQRTGSIELKFNTNADNTPVRHNFLNAIKFTSDLVELREKNIPIKYMAGYPVSQTFARFFKYGAAGAGIGLILRGILTGAGIEDWLFKYVDFMTWMESWRYLGESFSEKDFFIAIVFIGILVSLFWIYKIMKE